jgi:hypothetical protein
LQRLVVPLLIGFGGNKPRKTDIGFHVYTFKNLDVVLLISFFEWFQSRRIVTPYTAHHDTFLRLTVFDQDRQNFRFQFVSSAAAAFSAAAQHLFIPQRCFSFRFKNQSLCIVAVFCSKFELRYNSARSGLCRKAINSIIAASVGLQAVVIQFSGHVMASSRDTQRYSHNRRTDIAASP